MTAKIDEKKFLKLYDQYVDKIYRYIYFRVGSQELAQDLTSDVFLKSWQYLNRQESAGRGETIKNPRAFFYQVARNLIADFYRQKNKLPISLEEIADKNIADKDDSPIEKVLLGFEMDEVRDALSRLKDEYQEVIIWRYLDEMEIREIAEILEKPEGTVRVLLSRALASLREVLVQKVSLSDAR